MQRLVSALHNPTAMEIAPDGRVFVCEQAGAIRVINHGKLVAQPFATLPTQSQGERGLIGITVDPHYATNHYVYVYYTASSPTTHNRVSRFTADPTNPNVAEAGSEHVIFDLPNLSDATNHNGGGLHFGRDDKLYIGVGENANGLNSQSLHTTLGKLLRINANGSIPTDNPFYRHTRGQNRAIWALGLRNPYTFAFQPGTGRLFINDVGQDTWEEIDDGIKGANYGWPTTEGPTTNPRFRSPRYAYQHGPNDSNGQAIVGGTFYNPAHVNFPKQYTGRYFFSDLGGNWVHVLNPATNKATTFATGIPTPVDLDVASDGTLYCLARGGGDNTGFVERFVYVGTRRQVSAFSTGPAIKHILANRI